MKNGPWRLGSGFDVICCSDLRFKISDSTEAKFSTVYTTRSFALEMGALTILLQILKSERFPRFEGVSIDLTFVFETAEVRSAELDS